jgi:hypothetical protein
MNVVNMWADKDVEKGAGAPGRVDSTGSKELDTTTNAPLSFPRRVLHGFGRDPQATLLEGPEHNTLSKGLKKRHMAMIAAGSCIGTGLFVASGKALVSILYQILSNYESIELTSSIFVDEIQIN